MSADIALESAALFSSSLALYRRGAFGQAAGGLQQLLRVDPDHFEALHLQGVIATRLGHPEDAVNLLRKALTQDSSVAPAHLHLAAALRELGRLDEALGRYGTAIELRGDFKEAYIGRAMTLLMARRPADALADFDQAIALGADDAPTHTFRGSALIDLQHPADAVAACDRAIAKQPGLTDAHVNRAAALYLLGDYADALASCDRALELDRNRADAHIRRGLALYALLRLTEALASSDAALALQPQYAAAHHLRGLCLIDLQRPVEALASCDRAVALRPDLADAHNSRGLALADTMRFDAALDSFDRAIVLQPDVPEPFFNKGVRHLLAGDFERGWELYERRPVSIVISGKRWSGREDVAGTTFHTYSEQGLGDTLQFCRYARLLAARGARVTLSVQSGLRTLLQTLGSGIEVVELGVSSPHDYQCPLLSLPRAFGTRVDNIPADVPYLRADGARVSKWRGRLGRGGHVIGIRWQGSTARADAGRSFPLQYFAGIAAIPGVRLISLQRHAGAEQLLDLPAHWGVEDLGPDFEPGGDAFLDMAAVMECLDLVITSDTSVAHLAGALGRPTWVALKAVPDWRWLLNRDDSPWYPTMRLFRQQQSGDWQGVFDRMRREILTQ